MHVVVRQQEAVTQLLSFEEESKAVVFDTLIASNLLLGSE